MKKATLTLDKDFTVSKVDDRIFSTFIESLGPTVYGCIYNPEHPTANEAGFREDVIEMMKGINRGAVRYPGGNFVSGYHWMDGIGPRENRPVRTERAWNRIEPNIMGIEEYTDWVNRVGAQPMLAVNLGTGTPEEAANEVEYMNFEGGTTISDLRKKNGHEKPYNIKLWCLGNEMDGTWQLGEKTAYEYGRIAYEAAKQMRAVDPGIELVACGSCANDKTHPSFPDWDREVLEQCYDKVDYLSIHRYYNYDPQIVKGTMFPAQFTVEDLPMIPEDMASFVDAVSAAADFVKARKYSNKTINISVDEWGVMGSELVQPKGLEWTERTLPEKGERMTFHSNLIDAALFGALLITFLNKSDRVKIACQSVPIGGMFAVDPNGGCYKQTTYFPFQQAAAYSKGTALRVALDSPTQQTENYGEKPFVKAAAVYNEEEETITVFAVNLSLRESVELESKFAFENATLSRHIQLYDSQPLAVNSFENPNRVVPKEVRVTSENPVLPPLSWNVLQYKL
jgi:alpha-N-arabinofuranosidase